MESFYTIFCCGLSRNSARPEKVFSEKKNRTLSFRESIRFGDILFGSRFYSGFSGFFSGFFFFHRDQFPAGVDFHVAGDYQLGDGLGAGGVSVPAGEGVAFARCGNNLGQVDGGTEGTYQTVKGFGTVTGEGYGLQGAEGLFDVDGGVGGGYETVDAGAVVGPVFIITFIIIIFDSDQIGGICNGRIGQTLTVFTVQDELAVEMDVIGIGVLKCNTEIRSRVNIKDPISISKQTSSHALYQKYPLLSIFFIPLHPVFPVKNPPFPPLHPPRFML